MFLRQNQKGPMSFRKIENIFGDQYNQKVKVPSIPAKKKDTNKILKSFSFGINVRVSKIFNQLQCSLI